MGGERGSDVRQGKDMDCGRPGSADSGPPRRRNPLVLPHGTGVRHVRKRGITFSRGDDDRDDRGHRESRDDHDDRPIREMEPRDRSGPG